MESVELIRWGLRARLTTDCTAVGDEVVIMMIMMMLSMVMMCIRLSFLRLVDCCSLCGGWVGYGLGWVWVDDMDLHGQLCSLHVRF